MESDDLLRLLSGVVVPALTTGLARLTDLPGQLGRLQHDAKVYLAQILEALVVESKGTAPAAYSYDDSLFLRTVEKGLVYARYYRISQWLKRAVNVLLFLMWLLAPAVAGLGVFDYYSQSPSFDAWVWIVPLLCVQLVFLFLLVGIGMAAKAIEQSEEMLHGPSRGSNHG